MTDIVDRLRHGPKTAAKCRFEAADWIDNLRLVATEAAGVMRVIHHGDREDINFQALDEALTAVFGAGYSDAQTP